MAATSGSESLTVDEGRIDFRVDADGKLPNQVYFFDRFTILWSVSTDGGKTFKPMGPTVSPLYVLGAQPLAGAKLHETTVHITTKAAGGLSDSAAIRDAIWDEFADNEVRKVNSQDVLQYYGGGTANTPPNRGDVGTLLSNGDGRCGHWADFLVQAFATHGVAASFLDVTPPNGRAGFVVGASSAQGTGAADVSTTVFADHALVTIGTRIYDPSYGRLVHEASLSESIVAWETAVVRFVDPIPGSDDGRLGDPLRPDRRDLEYNTRQ